VHLLQHLAATYVHALLLGQKIGMREYARVVPLRVYPGLKIEYVSFTRALSATAIHRLRGFDDSTTNKY
jgi:hypothetical protein